MPYIVHQTEGNLRELARQFHQERTAGNTEQMVALYRKATGDQRPIGGHYGELPSLDGSWWIYNASHVMCSPHAQDCAKVRYSGSDGSKYASILATVCRQNHGGTWEVYWEY